MVELHCARAESDRERNLTDEIATSKHPRGSPTLSDSQRQEKSNENPPYMHETARHIFHHQTIPVQIN